MNLIQNLPEDVYLKLLNTEDALAAANYPVSGSYIPIGDFDRFGFIIMTGAMDTAVTGEVYQDTDETETASIKTVSTSAKVEIATTGDDKWYAIDVDSKAVDISNDFTHVTLKVTGPSGSNDYAAILFYGIPKVKPVTQPTGTGGEGETVVYNG